VSYYPEQLRAILAHCTGLNELDKNAAIRSTDIRIESSLPVLDQGKFIGRLRRTDKGWMFEPFKTDFEQTITDSVYSVLGNDPGALVNITTSQSLGAPSRVSAEFCQQR
jgi:hypothetical protein